MGDWPSTDKLYCVEDHRAEIRNHVFEIHGVNVINIFVQLPMEMNGPK